MFASFIGHGCLPLSRHGCLPLSIEYEGRLQTNANYIELNFPSTFKLASNELTIGQIKLRVGHIKRSTHSKKLLAILFQKH